MNAKQRFLNVLARKKTDRLPVTTHHLMPSYLGSADKLIFKFSGLLTTDPMNPPIVTPHIKIFLRFDLLPT